MLRIDYINVLRKNALRKRAFDLGLTLLSAPIWIPAIAISALIILISDGWPIFYRSWRQAYPNGNLNVVKFRTMVRNADQIANRDSIPATDTYFLNIPSTSHVYTPAGRVIERLNLTEIPQFFHVIAGQMSIVGNRPLPANVVDALRKRYPYVEDRFMSKAGLTGPVQLIGRDNLSDEDRLMIEIDYALACTFAYTMRLDLALLLNTVFVAAGVVKPYTTHTLRTLISRYTYGQVEKLTSHGEQRSFLRYPINLPAQLQLKDDCLVSVTLLDISYKGSRIALSTETAQITEISEYMDLRLQIPQFSEDHSIGLKSRVIECVTAGNEIIMRLEFTPDSGHGAQVAALIASKTVGL